MKLDIKELSFSYHHNNPVLQNVNMRALPGEVTVLLGPNGSGKSTLFKCITRGIRPQGDIYLDGKNIYNYKEKELVSIVSYQPQENYSRAVLTVFEAVLLGRVQSLSYRVGKEDLEIAYKTLEDLGIGNLAKRFLDELSGGQKQMVSIAQALVREVKVLLLDEPVSNLDLHYEMEILEWIRQLTLKKNITTIVSLHSLNLAARYADKAVLLKNGYIFASGDPQKVFTSDIIRRAYEVNCSVRQEDEMLFINPLNSVRKIQQSY